MRVSIRPLAASRGFNKLPYAGYSGANTVAQSLRPFPQFGNISALGVPLGREQVRLAAGEGEQAVLARPESHGDLHLAERADQHGHRIRNVLATNVFDHPEDVFTVSELSEPLITVRRVQLRGPCVQRATDSSGRVVGGWTFGGMVRYASGMPIPVPRRRTRSTALVFQTTTMNRVEGEPLFMKDLDGGDFDPNADFVLNPAAWVESRRPDSSEPRRRTTTISAISAGPTSSSASAGASGFATARASRFAREFFNAFNRIQLNNPDAANPLQTQQRNAQGVPTAGFGRINTGTVFGPPRSGQIVTRLSW